MKKARKTPAVVYIAVIMLVTVITFVTLNTIVLSKTISHLEKKAEATPLTSEAFEELYQDFLRMRTYLSISVDHDDIATVETELNEIIGSLAVGDTDGAFIAKSRLCGALGHLRRLSGFNIDSII